MLQEQLILLLQLLRDRTIINRATYVLGLFIATVCICVWIHLLYHFTYWKRQGVPYIQAKLIPNWLTKRKAADPLDISEVEQYSSFGRVYGRFDGYLPVLTVGDARALEKVFKKDFQCFQNRRDMKFNCPIMDKTLFGLKNPDWKRVRSIVSSTFSISKQRLMLSLLEGSCDYLLENFKEAYDTTGQINCTREFEKFVLHAIGSCAFGMDMSGLDDPDNEFVQHSRNLFRRPGKWHSLITSFPWLIKVLGIKLLNADSTEFFTATIVKALQERKESKGVRKDFLQMIMDVEEEGLSIDVNNNVDALGKEKKKLTHEEVLSQCATFFMAGSDSTSSLLSNVVYHLTKNQHVQQRVYEEMMQQDQSRPLFDTINSMKYLDGVISESLRIIPAMVRLERSANKDYLIETEAGSIQLKKGDLVSIPTYAMHHDPEYFPEPETFLPERFIKIEDREEWMSSVRQNPPCAFQGFGEGIRKCVAFKFVYMWTKLCIFRILENFKLVECDATSKSLEITENLGLLRIATVEVGLVAR